mgnify:CR=1 FL=1
MRELTDKVRIQSEKILRLQIQVEQAESEARISKQKADDLESRVRTLLLESGMVSTMQLKDVTGKTVLK